MTTPLESLISHLQAALTVARQMQEQTPPQAEQQGMEGDLMLTIVEKLDLEKTGETKDSTALPNIDGVDLPMLTVNPAKPKEVIEDPRPLITRQDEQWGKSLAYLITGGGELATIEKKYRFNDHDREHLDEIERAAYMLLEQGSTLNITLSQSCCQGEDHEKERELFRELAKTKGIK